MRSTDIQISPDDRSGESQDEPTGIIPFADEPMRVIATEYQSGALVHADDLGESAVDEFGTLELVGKRQSVVDRDLGLENGDTSAKRGGYSCPCCGDGARRVMRVRVLTHPRWVAVCAVCAASMLAKIPGTIVGGMVRPSRRRRSVRLQAAGVSRAEGQPGFRGRRETRYRRAG